MPFYERGPVRIHYQEVGAGFPLLLIPGGGLNSSPLILADSLTLQPDGKVQERLPLYLRRPAQRQSRRSRSTGPGILTPTTS